MSIESESSSPFAIEKNSGKSFSIEVLARCMNIVKDVLLKYNCHNNASNPYLNSQGKLVIRFDFYLHEAVSLEQIVWKLFLIYYEKLGIPFDQLQSIAIRSMDELLYADGEAEAGIE